MRLPTAPRLPFGVRWFPLVVIAILLLAWAITRITPSSGSSNASSGARTTTQTTPSSTATPSTAGSLPTCRAEELPSQVAQTMELIRAGGPFPYPRNDGVVFRNNARLLPQQPRGFYHEYTVPTPGAPNRGLRRIVTGGRDTDDPVSWYFTADHYESFCVLTDAR